MVKVRKVSFSVIGILSFAWISAAGYEIYLETQLANVMTVTYDAQTAQAAINWK